MMDVPQTLIYLLVFGCAFLLMQFIIGAGKQGARKVQWANMRLKVMASADSQSEALNKLRASRGIVDKNGVVRAMKWLDSMVVHSGLPLGVFGIYVLIVGSGLALALVALLVKPAILYVALGFGLGTILPVFVLIFLVNHRRNKAVKQLPEALDIIVRSLRAGHPVPVALELVAREMSDPVGSEFGIANDEITYGTGLGKALQRLAERVGHADYDLLAATIRLQERTGGNLGELLQTNAQMVRDRQKMRLKIRAASSEGRMSALILNAAPIILYVAIQLVAPSFYGDVEGNPVVRNGLTAIVIWMVIGNLIMRKMINFRI